METLNIVKLLENTPITKLSNTFNDKLIERVKQNFTNTEQKLFITSFYSYLNYDEIKDYVIDLNDIWKWLGFHQKIKLKILLQKYFKENTDYKILLPKQETLDKNKHGGHNKEIIMLNIKTFKLLCLKVDTSKASEIHEYYLKLEKILQDTIIEENKEFKQLFDKQNFQIKQLGNDKLKLEKDSKLEKHNLLLQEYGKSTPLIYLAKIKSYNNNDKENNGTYGVKIGESRKGISDRYAEHKTNYEECVFLDCFRVIRSKDFESFLHGHEKIKPNRITNLPGHENEKELFLIGKELSYAMLLNIIQTNIKNFDDLNYNNELEKLILENENLRLLIELNKTPNNNPNNNTTPNKEILDKFESLEKSNQILEKSHQSIEKSNKEILEKLNSLQTKNTSNFGIPLVNLGPKLQQINPENLKLIKVFDSVSECIKLDPKLKRSSINKAVKDNTIYQNYRWVLVDRELDSDKLHDIKPTKQVKKSLPLGYIAKLDKDKTTISNVYLDRKTAAKENDYKTDAALDNIVKKGSLSNGHYYMLYDQCSEELKKKFIEKNKGIPILYKNGVGQYNDKNKLIAEFVCKYDCARTLGIGDKTLNKSLENNLPYNGNYFKHLDKKIKCF